jgi:hypothetical protein
MGLRDLFNGNAIFDSMSQKYVGAILRAGLIGIGAVTAKDADNGQIEQLAGALIAMSSIAWSMYEKRQSRNVTVTALAMANTTENHVKSLIADPALKTPSPGTPANIVPIPILTLSEVERFTRPSG